MSSESVQSFTTWLYRGVIAILVSITLFFAQHTYSDFQALRADRNADAVELAGLKIELNYHNERLVKLEQK